MLADVSATHWALIVVFGFFHVLCVVNRVNAEGKEVILETQDFTDINKKKF